MHFSSKFFRIKIMKEFFKSNKKEILGVTAIIVILIIYNVQNNEYCTENIWVDDEYHYSETDSRIVGNYCDDKKDSLIYPFKTEIQTRLEKTFNGEITEKEFLDGLITVSSTDSSNGCIDLVYLYVHTQVVQENFDTVLQTQYYKDVDKFYKEITRKNESFDYAGLEKIGVERGCFK